MWKNHYFHNSILNAIYFLTGGQKLRISSFPLRIKWWNPSNACQKCTIDICHIQTSKMTLFWLRLMYNFNRKFTNFPLFHPSVNRHFEISIITSFHLYAVVDWLWARLQTSGTRTIAIYLHSQIQKSLIALLEKAIESAINKIIAFLSTNFVMYIIIDITVGLL
jgi:hypothetical protein